MRPGGAADGLAPRLRLLALLLACLLRDLLAGRLHTRVPATLLIAIGAIVVGSADTLNRFGSTGPYQIAKLLGVVLLFGGFLVSVETFREIRVPFTRRVLRGGRRETGELAER